MTAPVRVLFVCTGNICRSPVGERIMRSLDRAAWVAESAGIHAMTGSPIDPPMASLLEAIGIDTSGFAARGVTEELVREADVVLTMTAGHRRQIVDLVPAALARVFQISEFAWLVDQLVPRGSTVPPAEALQMAIADRPRLIASTGYRPSDIDDPYRRGAKAAKRAFDAISREIAIIAEATA